MLDTTAFLRQIEAMYERLGKLYTDASSNVPEASLLPVAFKELGVAAEELQVVTEELHQQNEYITSSLNQSTEECKSYQRLFDFSPQAQLITSLEGKIQEANQAAAQLLGVTQPSIVGKLLIQFVPQHYRSQFRSQLNLLQQSRQNFSWSAYLLKNSSGELMHLVLSTTVGRHTDNSPTIHWLLQDAATLLTALSTAQLERLTPKSEHKDSSSAATLIQSMSALERRPQHVYLKGETIPLKPENLWQVQDGLVKLTTLTEADEEILLAIVAPSMLFGIGLTSLLTYQAMAMTDVQLINIPIAEINASASLAQLILPKFHRRLAQAELLLNVSGQRPVKIGCIICCGC